jgi:pyruvate dehydrogenase E2 component (dihydrolipoamide acetyltransferase)
VLPSLSNVAEATTSEDSQAAAPRKEELRQPGAVLATPVARRVAKEMGVDISKVTGTGPGGRVKEEDVRSYAAGTTNSQKTSRETPGYEQITSGTPSSSSEDRVALLESLKQSTIDQDRVENFTTVPLNQIQTITGQRMLESVTQAPHFFLQMKVDMANALQTIDKARTMVQEETGARLSVTALLVKASAAALKKYPKANSSFHNNSLRIFSDVNIGVAVGSNDGLFVPVVKNADHLSLASIAAKINTFQNKAEGKTFNPGDLSGGTFTISNLGMYGVDVFTAIINPPQSCILAVGRIIHTPVALENSSISVKPLMTLTLSIDHRCMDGLQAAKFLGTIKSLIEEPTLML